MKNMLDLRFIIGFFFALVGLCLFVGSFIMHPEPHKTETVNFYSGIIYILFGVIMLLLWRFHRTEIKD